jgi:hypothetical protein
VARHGHSQVDVDLEVVADALVDAERVLRLAEQELVQLVPDEEADAGRQQDGRDPAFGGARLVGVADLGKGVAAGQVRVSTSSRRC